MHTCFHIFLYGSSADRMSNERLIKEQLRDIMRTEDLDNLTSKMVSRVQICSEEEVGLNKDRALLVLLQSKPIGQINKRMLVSLCMFFSFSFALL